MIFNSNILKHWDNKLTVSTLKHYQDLRSEHKQDIKPHSLITILAVFATTGSLNLLNGIRFENTYDNGFVLVLKALMVSLCIALYVTAFYNWRVFFSLRRGGINKDKNLFFAESAGLYRKTVFYIALAIDSVRGIQSYLHPEVIGQRMRRLKYQIRSEYYHDASIAVMESIVLSILFIEFMRIVLPGTFNWSDRKHMVVVLSMSLVISTFKVVVLNSASGHGVF